MSGERKGLSGAYSLSGAEEVRAFYDGWAAGYEAELTENGYVTPRRCAEALRQFAADPAEPVAEFGCGTGLGGLALRAAGFAVLDGFDISEEMLVRAKEKGIYRGLFPCDLSKPLAIEAESYGNAAAIGVINPGYMPPTVIDEVLRTIRAGGVFVFSINDRAAEDGTIRARIMDLSDCSAVDLLMADHGEHIPGTGLRSTVYALRKRGGAR